MLFFLTVLYTSFRHGSHIWADGNRLGDGNFDAGPLLKKDIPVGALCLCLRVGLDLLNLESTPPFCMYLGWACTRSPLVFGTAMA